MMDKITPETGAAIGGILGAIGMKLIDKVFGLKRKSMDEASEIRAELRVEVARLNKQLIEMHDELDAWRDRFYKLSEENIILRAECKSLRSEIEDLRKESR